jgi:uncharacterized protein YjbJ (UPF0337 family)
LSFTAPVFALYRCGTSKKIVVFLISPTSERKGPVDKDRIAGGAKKVTGKIKETVGKAVGDTRTEAEGKADQARGRAQAAAGHAKDAAREITGKK